VRAKNHQPIDREHHRQIGTDHDTHIAHFVRHEKGNPLIKELVRHRKDNSHIVHFVRREKGDSNFLKFEKGERGRGNEFHNIDMQRNSKTINKTETLTLIGPFFHPLTLPLAFHRAWGMSTIGI